MPEAATAIIKELGSISDSDRVAIVGLLAVHALVNGDLAKLDLLKLVAERLPDQAESDAWLELEHSL